LNWNQPAFQAWNWPGWIVGFCRSYREPVISRDNAGQSRSGLAAHPLLKQHWDWRSLCSRVDDFRNLEACRLVLGEVRLCLKPMKNPISMGRKQVAAAFLTVLASLSLAWLAPAQPGGGRGLGGGGVLDAQQRTAFNEALQASREQMAQLNTNLAAATTELCRAALATNYSEALVTEKAGKVATIQAQMMVLRARALACVAPTLTADQTEQLLTGGAGIPLLTGSSMNLMGGLAGAGGPALQQAIQDFMQGNLNRDTIQQAVREFQQGNMDPQAMRQAVQDFMQNGGGEAMRQRIQEFMQQQGWGGGGMPGRGGGRRGGGGGGAGSAEGQR
jgi:hypothetical protein